MGVGTFSGESSSTDMEKEALFRMLYEEHHILSEWSAQKFVDFLRDPKNVAWVDQAILKYGLPDTEEVAIEFTAPDDPDDADTSGGGGGGDKENNTESARSRRKRSRDEAAAAVKAKTSDSASGGKGKKKMRKGNAARILEAIQQMADDDTEDDNEGDTEPEDNVDANEGLTDYELSRKRNIARNKDILRSLKLDLFGLGGSGRKCMR